MSGKKQEWNQFHGKYTSNNSKLMENLPMISVSLPMKSAKKQQPSVKIKSINNKKEDNKSEIKSTL